MKTLDRVLRTPGLLTMFVLMIAFVVNGGVEYIDATGTHSASFMAAIALFFGQLALLLVTTFKRIRAKQTPSLT